PLNIGTGVGTTVNEIYWRLAALLGYSDSPEYAPKRPGEIERTYLNSKRAQKELGWMPRVTFEEGLSETAAWFRAQANA
ncbi:MAG: UDP-glucose 4-epimerase, partial [Armatimonadetes bacterium]|nr:UDP-glucose 4-epimerase [Armatimonadota bacterium]NIO74884.1 UDP-glucose 4-epimerase [Armatimonadota bacterium]NIO95645.1 UDP-glucose 4-epimerase [Armatimonadota bacterium]